MADKCPVTSWRQEEYIHWRHYVLTERRRREGERRRRREGERRRREGERRRRGGGRSYRISYRKTCVPITSWCQENYIQ